MDTTAILASIDSLRSAYEQAVAERDWERLGSLVTGEAIMVPPGDAAWDSLYPVADGPFPEGATLDISPMEVRVLSTNWAYDMGNGTVTRTPEGAAEPPSLQDTYLVRCTGRRTVGRCTAKWPAPVRCRSGGIERRPPASAARPSPDESRLSSVRRFPRRHGRRVRGGPARVSERRRFAGYRSGHTMYLRAEDLEAANQDIRESIEASIPRDGQPASYRRVSAP